jgi:hypothetical protein
MLEEKLDDKLLTEMKQYKIIASYKQKDFEVYPAKKEIHVKPNIDLKYNVCQSIFQIHCSLYGFYLPKNTIERETAINEYEKYIYL